MSDPSHQPRVITGLFDSERAAQQILSELLRTQDELTSIRADLPTEKMLSDAVANGIKSVISDAAMMQKLSKVLYDELVSHSSNDASQWIGKRLMQAAAVALFTASITIMVKTGVLK